MTQAPEVAGALPRRTEYMRVDQMTEALENPKGHDGPRIRGAIERFGFLDQPVLDERTGRLVHGHGRLDQLRAMMDEGDDPPDGLTLDGDGNWLWPVTRGWSSRSDDEAHAVGVTLNRLSELGGWDDLPGLTSILDRANEMDPALLNIIGYTSQELDTLRAITDQQDGSGLGEDDEDILRRTDQAAWPRITCQVPPDVHERWLAIPGADDGDRVMATLRAWEAGENNVAVRRDGASAGEPAGLDERGVAR